MTETQYHFPILDEPDLISGLQSSLPEVGIGPEDFRNPKAERWQPFYFTILEYLVGVTPEQLNQTPLDMLDQVEYPEIHEDSNRIFFLTLAMQRLMKACGVDDFRVRDVVDPKPRRLKRLVSALINFANFKEQRMVFYDRIKHEEEVMLEQKDHLEKENDDLLQKINTIKAEHAEQEPEIIKYQKMIEQLTGAISEKRRATEALQKTIKDDKACNKEKNAKVAQQKEVIAGAKAERDRLSRQIVQSPERMRSEMDRTERQVASLKQCKEELQARHMELQKQAEICRQQEADCEAGLKLIKAIQLQIEMDRELNEAWKKLKEQKLEREDQLRDRESSERQMKRQITTKQERLTKLTLQHENKIRALTETLQQLKNEQNIIQQQHLEEGEQRRNIEEQRWQLNEADKISTRNHEETKKELAEKYAQLMEELDRYHVKLAKAWQKTKGNLEAHREK